MEDVRPKAVFSNFFRGVCTEVKSLSDVQFVILHNEIAANHLCQFFSTT